MTRTPAVITVVAGLGLIAGARAKPTMPGPSVGGRPGAAEANAACETCHTAIARSWRASLHRTAFSDPDFASAFAREPRAFCRSCHAPEADSSHATTSSAAEIGVGCVTCHAPERLGQTRVLAGPSLDARDAAPHGLMRIAAFASTAGCASCHEFGFADDPARLMQSTVSEHARSPAAGISCVDCHMPRRAALGGQRDHGFAASRDPASLRAAVEIEATRIGDDRVSVTLTPARLGHAFPTGDMFRAVTVLARARDGDRTIATDAVTLARSFADGHRTEVDTRIGAGGDYSPRTVDLVLRGARGLSVTWAVLYQRRDMSRSADADPAVFATVELAAGRL